MLGTGCCSISVSPLFVLQSLPEELVVGGPRWVSQWATLAASHIRTDPEGSGAESHVHYHTEDRGATAGFRPVLKLKCFDVFELFFIY